MAIVESKLEKAVKARSETEREKAIRLSTDVHKYSQQILSWYQFKDPEALSKYIVKVCDVKELRVRVSYDQVRFLVSGGTRHESDDNLRWIHSTMRRMAQAAEEGTREVIPFGLRKQFILPNDESLRELIKRSLKEVTGKVDLKILENIEELLEDAEKVRKPSDLIQRLYKVYGFASPWKTQELLADVAGIELSYKLLDLTGHRRPRSNYHYKMYAVALVLDYAQKQGFKDQAVEAVLERGRRRSARAREHIKYLVAPRSKYTTLIKEMESNGLRGYVLKTILSQLLGISIAEAEDYTTRRNDMIDLDVYNKLKEFADYGQPNIFSIDLSDKKKIQSEYNRFKKNYRRGMRILVIYKGPKDDEVNRMVGELRDEARKRLGLTFKFDPRNVVDVPGIKSHQDLLSDSKYLRF